MRELRYFKPHEFECPVHCGQCLGKMDEVLLAKLDELRHRVEEPLIINSGYRCEARNRMVGGAPASSHMKGLAVDIACECSTLRFKLVKHAIELGFRRIEPMDTWVHLDIDPDKPQDVMFFGRR